MHITSATEDFRKIADRLRFHHGDLVPVEDREGWWRVPPQLLLQEPAFVSLTRLYNQTEVPNITQRAKSRRRRMILRTGPDLLLIGDHLSTGPNELFIGIRVPKPLELQSGTPGALRIVEDPDTEASNRQAPPNSSNNATPVTSRPGSQEHKEISSCGGERHCIASEEQNEIDEATSNLSSVTSRPREPLLGEGRTLSTMRKQLEFVIRSITDVHHSIESPALGVGDILELDELEYLQVKSGFLPVLGMGYRVEGFVDGG